jgi:hypothetical protein
MADLLANWNWNHGAEDPHTVLLRLRPVPRTLQAVDPTHLMIHSHFVLAS